MKSVFYQFNQLILEMQQIKNPREHFAFHEGFVIYLVAFFYLIVGTKNCTSTSEVNIYIYCEEYSSTE